MRVGLLNILGIIGSFGNIMSQSASLSEAFINNHEISTEESAHYPSPLLRPDGTIISTLDEWEVKRSQIRNEWLSIIGEWPELPQAKPLQITDSTNLDGITQYTVSFDWLSGISTQGYLLIPDDVSGLNGAVITLYYEPETAIGLNVLPDRDFALQLARRGLIALSLGSTETTINKTYGLYYPSIENSELQPLSAMAFAAANAYESLALDPRVDASKIGVMGHSYGGKWAMFASCLYDKFACAVWGDPGIVFDETKGGYINYWEPWYLGYYPPPWEATWTDVTSSNRRGAYAQLIESGHDLHELHALMAPRPFLISGGYSDGIERLQALKPTLDVYDLYNVRDRVAMTFRPEHSPNPVSNQAIYDFFTHFLSK